MRRAVTVVAAACLLLGPTVLAFFSGGYYAEPRLIAGLVTWTLVLALAVTGRAPLPRTRPGSLALGGLVLLTAWSAVSVTWAPLGGPAIQGVQRLVLYVGTLIVAVGTLRSRSARRAVEPVLAIGATIVISYGLAGRLLPGIVELARSRSAGGRLEQPLTYWNAEGALAALALVLCARLAGDVRRPAWLRALAAAAAAPLGAGIYLSYSRGAIAAAALGLVVLLAAAPTRAQHRAAAAVLATGVAGALACSAFPGVAELEGAASDRIRDGALALTILAGLAAAAGLLTARHARAAAGADAPMPWAHRIVPVAGVAGVAGLAGLAVAIGLVAAGLGERPDGAELGAGARAERLTSASSNRYEYWDVAMDAFGREPLTGVGAGGFRVEWLRERTIPEAVRDAHSLPMEVAAELGAVGLLALAIALAGAVLAARRALRRDGATAAGWCAAAVVWLAHASIDWAWQLPAITLPALVLAGALIALGEDGEAPAPAGSPSRTASTPVTGAAR